MTATQLFVLDRGLRWLVIAAAASTAFVIFTIACAYRDRRNHHHKDQP